MSTVDYLILGLFVGITAYAIWSRTYHYQEFLRKKKNKF